VILTLNSAEFMLRLSRSFHRWERVTLPRCQMCNSAKLLAAFSCADCKKTMCRPCFRRIHSADSTWGHSSYAL
jgi:hypothetical protein